MRLRSWFLSSFVGLVCVTFIGCSSTGPADEPNTDIRLDTLAAVDAGVWLNIIRMDPPAHSLECNFDLSGVEPRNALNHSQILQSIAREKALDMARRNYMAHQDPDGKGIDHLIVAAGYPLDKEDYFIDESTANYESLQSAGTSEGDVGLTGKKAITDLIWDGGLPNGGHREHLLGIGARSTLDEYGIGFVRCKSGTMYKNYCCVIIAKRKK